MQNGTNQVIIPKVHGLQKKEAQSTQFLEETCNAKVLKKVLPSVKMVTMQDAITH